MKRMKSYNFYIGTNYDDGKQAFKTDYVINETKKVFIDKGFKGFNISTLTGFWYSDDTKTEYNENTVHIEIVQKRIPKKQIKEIRKELKEKFFQESIGIKVYKVKADF